MSRKANYFKIGVFVVSASIIAIIAIVALGVGTMFQEKIMLETYIDGAVKGLNVGSPLKLRGVQIGSVEEIVFVGEEYPLDPESEEFLKYGQYILIKMSLKPRREITEKKRLAYMERLIKKGLRVRLASQGITGAAFLEADYLDPEKHPPLKIVWKPKTYYLPSAPSTFTELTDSVERILTKLEQMDILGMTDGVKNTLSIMSDTMKDANVKNLSRKAEELLTDFKETNRLLSSSITSELPEILTDLRKTLHRFNNMISHEEQDIGISADNIRMITENIRELTENTKKYPSHLLFGNPPPPSKFGGTQR
ncbi:MAG: MlaD family protein [Candidatus Brocadiaceae bacterium]|nr:MlaD family protein [Candidatus Brocadiaceae bacterium]